MIISLFKCILFICIMGYYSLSVWRGINDYYRKELSSYITSEYKNPQCRPYSLDEAKIQSTIDSQPKYVHEPDSCVASAYVAADTENTKSFGINPILPTEQSSSNNYEPMREHSKSDINCDVSFSDAIDIQHGVSNVPNYAANQIPG